MQPTHIRDVHAQTFTGRDTITNINIDYSGAELQTLLDQLLPLLRTDDVRVQGGNVSTVSTALAVAPAQQDALDKFMTAAAVVQDEHQRLEHYLTSLCLQFQRWQQRYVALSGGYQKAILDPKFSKILVRGDGPQREIERVHLDDIRDLLAEHPCAILLARPGAGKSTVLRRLTLDMALQRLQKREGLLPLFVSLASQKADETPQDFLARHWCEALPGSDPADFHRLLQQGKLCLLCDALNESRRQNYQHRVDDWRDFAAMLPAGNGLLFSCRTLDYNGVLKVQQAEIDPLTQAQIQEFAQRNLGIEEGARFGDALATDSHDLLSLAQTPYYLQLLVDIFQQAGTLPHHRAQLFQQVAINLLEREAEKRHPTWIEPAAQHLALSKLAYAMQHQGDGTELRWPEVQATIPSQVTIGTEVYATPCETIMELGQAATLLTEHGSEQQPTIKFSHHLLQEYFAAEELLRQVQRPTTTKADLAGLWQVPTTEAEMPDAPRGEWDPLPLPPTTGWEETTILAAGLYPALIEIIRPINLALAARCLLESGPEQAGLDDLKQGLQEDLLNRLRSSVGETMRETEFFGKNLVSRIHLRSRMEAGLLLGELGDPRFPVERINGTAVILPQMVEIDPRGAMVGSPRSDKQAHDNEFPRHRVRLAPYALARYPVTNAEYRCFMAAGGYEEERWWTANGQHWLQGEAVPGEADPGDFYLEWWQRFREEPERIDHLIRDGQMTERVADTLWRILITRDKAEVRAWVQEQFPVGETYREPRYWQDENFNNPSQPVVGICWYEAVAYTKWLAEITGQPYGLPTEPEWAWAARRGRRTYPWGQRWHADRCNSLEARIMRTTPVGIYPNGATSDGLSDLSGNVREWTSSRYAAYPNESRWQRWLGPLGHKPQHRAADLDDLEAIGGRINRGGSWSSNQKMVRCGFRNGNNGGILNLGLRLARASS